MNLGAIVALRMMGLALNFIAVLVVRISWGTESVGLLAISLTIPAIIGQLLSFGIENSFPYLAINQKEEISHLRKAANSFGLLVVAMNFGILLVAPIISNRFFADFSSWQTVLVLLTPSLLYYTHVCEATCRGVNRTLSAATIRFSGEVTLAAILALASFTGSDGRFAVFGASVASRLTPLILGVCLCRHQANENAPFQLNLMKRMLAFGLRSQLGNIINLLNYRLDQLVLAFYLPLNQVGIYVLVTKAAEFVRIVPTSFRFAIEPRLASVGPHEIAKIAKKWSTNLSLVCLSVCAIFWIGERYFLDFLLADEASMAILPFNILLVGTFTFGLNAVISAYNTSHGFPIKNAYAVGCSLVVTVILDFVLVPTYGIWGAALASTCAYWTATLVLLAIFFLENRRNIKCLNERGVID